VTTIGIVRGTGTAVAGIALVGLILAGCGVAASRASSPPGPPSAAATVPPAIVETRRLVDEALGRAGLTLQDATQPFRPPEAPSMVGASRGVFQVVLPNDPVHGYFVIYAFRDAATATTAARDQAMYLASGPGSIQLPPDAQALLRQVDTTIIAYSWSPANSTDSRAGSIMTALATVGLEVPIPQ
jgi:hypothetical protein